MGHTRTSSNDVPTQTAKHKLSLVRPECFRRNIGFWFPCHKERLALSLRACRLLVLGSSHVPRLDLY